MFVMLSVHTNTTVRERQADTVIKKVTNQLNCSNNNNYIDEEKRNWKNFNGDHHQPAKLLYLSECKSLDDFSLIKSKNKLSPAAAAIIKTTAKTISATASFTSIEQGASILRPQSLNTATAPSPKFLQQLSELNNFKKPQTVQVPVATILNDLSPIPAPVKVKNIEHTNHPMSPMIPAGLPNITPDIKAMRYYRLWIYTCNAVLLLAVIVFCGVAGKVLLLDYKRLLVTGITLTHFSFLYAYAALLVQSGFLQVVGCLGALRLSEKLLNTYWLLLLGLLVGDALIGAFWLYKYEKLLQELQPALRYRFAHEYGNSIEFTELWDRLQIDGQCCGVIGSTDYTFANRTYPTSCCNPDITEQISIARRPMASAVVYRSDDLIFNTIREHRNMTDIADAMNHVVTAARGSATAASDSISSSSLSSSSSQTDSKITTIATCRAVHPHGCIKYLSEWLKSTADILFVLGYCVIAFLKICFIGILRYEIKEMIQKIKLMQTEMAAAILQGECGPDGQQTQPQVINPLSINGGLQYTEPKVGNRDRDRNRIDSMESERESLLVHENTPKLGKHNKQLYRCINSDVGNADSDTNSNCALIVDEITNHPSSSSSCLPDKEAFTAAAASSSIAQHQVMLQHQMSSTSAATATKTINGNNNYELTEFENKASNYRDSVWGFKVSQELLV